MSLDSTLKSYMQNGKLLNTIFFGIGDKLTTISNMLNPDNEKCVETENLWENIPFYSTPKYIRFDCREFVKSRCEIVSVLEELSAMKNINSTTTKLFWVDNVDCIEQNNFRQIIEDSYATSRFIFTCTNIDMIDPAIKSRCVLIHLKDMGKNKFIRMLDSMNVESPDQHLHDEIMKTLIDSKTVREIHELAEKIYISEIDIVRMFHKIEIDDFSKFVCEIQKFAAIQRPSQYDIFLLFLKMKKYLQN